MPAIGDISINDAETTPVAHVFSPVSTDGSRSRHANRVATIPQGFELLSLEVREPQSASGAYRLIGSMTFPEVATVNGADAVVRSAKANFDINFPQTSTAQERKNALKLLSNLFAHATVVTMVDKLEPIY